MSRRRTITGFLLLVILAVTIVVVAGIGQGSPPKALPISEIAAAREVAAVEHGSATVKEGEKLFDSHGCDDCHTMAAGNYRGRLGPRLDVQSQGDPLEDVETNIVHPPDDDAGYEKGLMPENFGSRLSKHDIDALAVYIHAAASAAAAPAKPKHTHHKQHGKHHKR